MKTLEMRPRAVTLYGARGEVVVQTSVYEMAAQDDAGAIPTVVEALNAWNGLLTIIEWPEQPPIPQIVDSRRKPLR